MAKGRRLIHIQSVTSGIRWIMSSGEEGELVMSIGPDNALTVPNTVLGPTMVLRSLNVKSHTVLAWYKSGRGDRMYGEIFLQNCQSLLWLVFQTSYTTDVVIANNVSYLQLAFDYVLHAAPIASLRLRSPRVLLHRQILGVLSCRVREILGSRSSGSSYQITLMSDSTLRGNRERVRARHQYLCACDSCSLPSFHCNRAAMILVLPVQTGEIYSQH